MLQRVIFHVDANSAFLSWSAAYRIKVLGEKTDLRQIPSVVAGDQESRRGIILAKSTFAKKYGIQTGEPLFQALQKCPSLTVVPPDYDLYVAASRHFVELLRQFSPIVEQYSIDEAWVDMTGTERLFGSPRMAAETLRKRVWEELGFTVNVGISSNKLLAKMAGDLEKPDKVHTLFPDEIEAKMWPLPVRDLFSIGAATQEKLAGMGIYTIGELAKADVRILRKRFGKNGETLWHYANGRNADVVKAVQEDNKSYGNSTTTSVDVTDRAQGQKVLMGLCETVAMRLREDDICGRCVTVSLRTSDFHNFSHQSKLDGATNITQQIFQAACRIFDEMWDGVTPLRQLCVHITQLAKEPYQQFDLFSDITPQRYDKKLRLDEAVDALRDKYGEDIIRRGKFADCPEGHMAGGLHKERRTGITKPVPREF